MLEVRVRDSLILTRLGLILRIVERVLLHVVEPPPEEAFEGLRVFVVFSGMAGAWRAIKELDGRFFGGKKIVSGSALVERGSPSSGRGTLTNPSSTRMTVTGSLHSIHTYEYSTYHVHMVHKVRPVLLNCSSR